MRTVILPLSLPPSLLRALFDVRSAVNHLLPDWRAHPEESRFAATKRTYAWVRTHYPHLASSWAVSICNETSATLNSWDRLLRRYKRHDPARWERLKDTLPRRRRLKASLHPALYRLRGRTLDITLDPRHHFKIDLSGTKNPLFWKYGEASGWKFGLTLTDRSLVFNFHVPQDQPEQPESAGVDVNMPSADYATSDGRTGSVDLTPVTRVQGAMARKRISVQRSLPTDLRLQRRVLRRLKRRERNRVAPLLHRAANELLERVGERNVVLEDLSKTQEELMKTTKGKDARRRLSVWTQGQFQRIVEYKAHTRVLHVNPRGTSSECPRCGGRLDHPEWRRSVCGDCQGDWHRDGVAATNILIRGQAALRGRALAPRALDALLEAARWRASPTSPPVKGDEAKLTGEGLPFQVKVE